MRRLYVVRHGESEGNLAGVLQGARLDPPLTPRGRRQAEALAVRLSTEEVDVVVSSPLRRARDTAEVIAAPHGLGVALDPELVEFDWGLYTGRVLEGETEREIETIRSRWRAGDTALGPPAGETPDRARDRAAGALERALSRGSRVCLVAHGRFNRILMTAVLSRAVSRMEEIKQRNASLSLFSENGSGSWEAVLLDDVGHLDESLASPSGATDSTR